MHSTKSEKKRHPGRIIAILILIVVGIGVLWYLNSDLWERSRYPLSYTEIIRENASRYDLDPYRVAAVIRTESGFDPEAVSGAGAMGLMQIMPETGEWIADKLDMENFQLNTLFDPAVNIEIGCWYLDFLADRFDDPELIAAAYNAGHGRVAQWLGDDTVSADGEHIETIPFPETRDYVERISEAYDAYRRLYPDAFS